MFGAAEARLVWPAWQERAEGLVSSFFPVVVHVEGAWRDQLVCPAWQEWAEGLISGVVPLVSQAGC